MDEARQSPRHRVLKSGSIRFGDVAISCVLRNLSPVGVALDIGTQVGIPDQFTLIVVPGRKSIRALSFGEKIGASVSRFTN